MNEIEKAYNPNGQTEKELAQSYNGGDIVPIYTSEQLAKVGTGETAYSSETGKVYTFSDDKTYMFYGESEDITDVINRIVSNVVNEKVASIYPVGSIYLSTTETNPGTYLGGVWESYGQGRTLIGAGEGTDTNGNRQNFLAGTVGGEYVHTLSIEEMPSHTHIQNGHEHNCRAWLAGYAGWNERTVSGIYYVQDWTHGHILNGDAKDYTGNIALSNMGISSWVTATNQNTGGSQSHNNVQPYITCYMWKRVQ